MNGPERIGEPERVSGAERSRPDGRRVRELVAGDAHAAGSALALAFETDPHMQWIFHDAGRRLARLQRMWTTLIERAWLERGSCHILEHGAGACIWLPPDGWQMSLAAQARMLPPLAAAIRDALPRLLGCIFSTTTSIHASPRTGIWRRSAWRRRGRAAGTARRCSSPCCVAVTRTA
jgi:hypothetical protein